MVDPDSPVSARPRKSNESIDCDRMRLCFLRPFRLTFGFFGHLLNEDDSEIEENDLVSRRDDDEDVAATAPAAPPSWASGKRSPRLEASKVAARPGGGLLVLETPTTPALVASVDSECNRHMI